MIMVDDIPKKNSQIIYEIKLLREKPQNTM